MNTEHVVKLGLKESDLERICKGLCNIVREVGCKLLHFLVVEQIGVYHKRDGGRYSDQGDLEISPISIYLNCIYL